MTVPPYESGPVVTVLPGHIQDAVIKRGMVPLAGLGTFGDEWAPRTSGSTKDEVQEALKAYERPEGWESESDCSSESSFHFSDSDCLSVQDMDLDSNDFSGSTGSGVGMGCTIC